MRFQGVEKVLMGVRDCPKCWDNPCTCGQPRVSYPAPTSGCKPCCKRDCPTCDLPELRSQVEILRKERDELKKKVEAEEFWRDVFPKGANKKQLEDELTDYHFILEQVCVVYDHITGGLLCKQNYYAQDVIAAADEHYSKLHEDDN